VVGGEDEEVVVVEEGEPERDGGVDLLEGGGEAGGVVAVAVELVGLDEVGEGEAVVEVAEERGGRRERLLVGLALVGVVDPLPAKRSWTLPTEWTGMASAVSSSR
jgi:hypothetical protein